MYPEQEAKSLQVGTSRPQSMTERLRGEKERLEFRLAQVNEALTAMEENPEVAKTVDAIIKVGW